MPTSLAALGMSAVGSLAAAVGDTVSKDGGGDLASYVQGGGSAAAVAGLVYVARLIVRGELVPRPVKDSENELGASILAAAQREDRVLKIAEVQQADAVACRERSDRTIVALTEVSAAMRDVASEMEYWRAIRQRGTRREDGK